MTAWALILILAAAFIHASWNFLAKRASGHATFTWLFAVLSALFYAPVAAALVLFYGASIGWVEIGFMAGSAALHTAYFVLLNQGYRSGDSVAGLSAGARHRAAAFEHRGDLVSR